MFNKLVKGVLDDCSTLMNSPGFWDDKKASESVIEELNSIKSVLDDCSTLKNKIDGDIELINMLTDSYDEEVMIMINDDIESIESSLSSLENLLVLNGPYDKGGAILEIHPGAGGTESCDWANMLYRMYSRWCSNKGYKVEVIDYQDGKIVCLNAGVVA